MKPWVAQQRAELIAQRPADADDDVHFTESLAALVLDEYSKPDDVVLDPFAGYGTTLAVAERMGRAAVGVELLTDHAEIIRDRVVGPARLIVGDARRLESLVSGPIDLCLTSPPYMAAVDHPENPLNAYETLDGDYGRYLDELDTVFAQVARLLRPGGHAVVNVGNVASGDTITPLIWDLGRVLSRHLVLRAESYLCWDEPPDGITADVCLVFQRP
jgi:DNA modification methylase